MLLFFCDQKKNEGGELNMAKLDIEILEQKILKAGKSIEARKNLIDNLRQQVTSAENVLMSKTMRALLVSRGQDDTKLTSVTDLCRAVCRIFDLPVDDLNNGGR